MSYLPLLCLDDTAAKLFTKLPVPIVCFQSSPSDSIQEAPRSVPVNLFYVLTPPQYRWRDDETSADVVIAIERDARRTTHQRYNFHPHRHLRYQPLPPRIHKQHSSRNRSGQFP